MRLAILVSHPIQYYSPLFREIAQSIDVVVFYAHRATPAQQGTAGFGTAFEWDLDLFDGYRHVFLTNVAREPGAHHFRGCDTPEIGKRLGEGGFDALLVMGWHLKCFWQATWAAKRRGIPVFVRGDSQLEAPRSLLKRSLKAVAYPKLLRVFDVALYVGRRNRAYYEHYRYPAERLFFSPHCIDTNRFATAASARARLDMRARQGIGQDEKVALFAGKLIDFKRPLDLIDAAAVVRAQGLPLRVMVAGSGPLESAMRKRAEMVKVPLYMLGFQNQTEMPAAYASADVLALPSTGRETWGLVCNEALACGIPIVVSEAAGCGPDLAADETVGRTYPLGDVRALAGELVATLSVPANSAQIRRASDRYSPAAAAAGVISALQQCCGQVSRGH